MRTKPFIFNFISLILIGVVIALPLQIILQTGTTDINLKIFVNQLSIFNWLLVGFSIITAIYSFFADSKVVFASLVLLASVYLNNYFVYSFSTNLHWSLPVLSSAFSTVIIGLIFANKQFRFAVKNQSQRWWLIPKRHKKTLPIWIQINDDKCLLARTYDVSKSGTFVSSISGIQNFLEKGLSVGNNVKVLIGDKDNIEFQCEASVVRKTKAIGDYPSGIGLHFDKMGLKDKFALNRIISEQGFV